MARIYDSRPNETIGRPHPFDRTRPGWRRRQEGGYDEGDFTGGIVALHALPGVTIDLDALFVTED